MIKKPTIALVAISAGLFLSSAVQAAATDLSASPATSSTTTALPTDSTTTPDATKSSDTTKATDTDKDKTSIEDKLKSLNKNPAGDTKGAMPSKPDSGQVNQ